MQTGSIERWEETKKQQKQIEKVKTKLVASEVECEKLRANNEMMKNALDRYVLLAIFIPPIQECVQK